jgi:hypothetical protein
MYSSYSFTTSALDGREWSASRPGRALPPGKGPLVPIGQEAGWAPEPVWTQVRREISCLCRGLNLDSPVVQSVVRLYTEWATPAPYIIYTDTNHHHHPVCSILQCLPVPKVFHRSLSIQSPSCRFLSAISVTISCFHVVLGLPLRLRPSARHSSSCLGRRSFSILFTWPYHINCFFRMSSTTFPSSPIISPTLSFRILSIREIPAALASITFQWPRLSVLPFSLTATPYTHIAVYF